MRYNTIRLVGLFRSDHILDINRVIRIPIKEIWIILIYGRILYYLF